MATENGEPREAKVPTIILKLTDPLTMNVECDLELDRLPVMRVMLLEALRTVDGLLGDQHQIEFMRQMNQIERATRAALAKPGLKI